MDIGEVTKQANIPASTLRYYEEKGLIKPIGRNGLRRVYAEGVLEKLALISLGQSAGLSLDDIGKMLLPEGVEVDRALLIKRADELDKQIDEMTAMRDGLRHAAKCEAPTHLECPTFRRYLDVLGKRRKK